ncbi:MAG: hypothetical protein KDC71_07135 [Acidobacteria bacterium]|nr:hypothetical protein [Acidobacteriota bacterium]
MNPVWELFIVVALLYVSECWIWLPNGARFIGLYAGRALRIYPPSSLSLSRGGLVFSSPLPWDLSFRQPLYDLVVSSQLAGIVPFSEPGGSVPKSHFESAAPDPKASLRASDSGLFLGHQRLCPSLNPRHSQWLVDYLKRCLDKGKSAKTLSKVFDTRLNAPAQAELSTFLPHLAAVRITATLEWLFIFAAFPLVFWIGLPAKVWWSVLGLWTILHLFHLLVFWRTHQRLFPNDRSERLGQTLLQLVAPTIAMRAAHRLSINALPQLHPLLLLAHFGQRDAASDWAQALIRDLQFPIGSYSELIAKDTEPWETYRRAQILSLQRFLAQWEPSFEGHEPKAPKPSGRATHYCPRCWTVFIQAETCHLCANRETVPFPSAALPEPQASEKSA